MSRSSNEVSDPSDLPSWFDISKYESAMDLDYNGWYENLFARARLIEVIASPVYKTALTCNSGMVHNINSDLRTLRLAPVYGSGAGDEINPLFALRQLMLHGNDYIGVRQMTVRDLYLAEKQIDEKKINYARKHVAEFDAHAFIVDLYEFTEREQEWESNPLDDVLPNGLIKVDFLLPKKLLIEQFESILKMNQPKNIIKLNTKKWFDFGVLPYLDLKIYELESDVHFVHHLLYRAIYPEGQTGDDKIRDVRRYANNAISEKSLRVLADFASNEKAENINRRLA